MKMIANDEGEVHVYSVQILYTYHGASLSSHCK